MGILVESRGFVVFNTQTIGHIGRSWREHVADAVVEEGIAHGTLLRNRNHS